ncbi:MAG: UDP-N-acetylmuramate--L-alanine ligase [bacterium]
MDITKIEKHKHYYFIGIGGTGMSALARALLEMGVRVSGSDLNETITTIKLKDLGANIYIGHSKNNLQKAQIIVVSTAINNNNPELKFAKEEKIPILHRADLLSHFINACPKSIIVTGTHGKTTTSAMLVQILTTLFNKVPTFIIGSTLNNFNKNSHISDSEYGVFEADESDGSFTKLAPYATIISNLEAEHLEYYNNEETLLNTFQTYIHTLLKKDKIVLINRECPQLQKITHSIKNKNLHHFSLNEKQSIHTHNIQTTSKGISCKIKHKDKTYPLDLQIFGHHNIENAISALSFIALEQQNIEPSCKSLNSFTGTKRRTEWIGKANNIDIYDDYAHHPSEIHCTLKGLKESLKRPLLCIFQPHRYSRTLNHFNKFAEAFEFADTAIITKIYAASETAIPNITAKELQEQISKTWPNKTILFIQQKSLIAKQIMKKLKKNQVIITMGAGDIHTVSKEILTQLKQHNYNA